MIKKYSVKGKYYVVALVLLLGAVISFGLFLGAQKIERTNLIKEFDSFCDERLDLIEKSVQDCIELLQTVASFYASSVSVERDEFRIFVENILKRHKEILSIDWMPRVGNAERLSFEEKIRREGFQNFQITERDESGKFVRSSRRNEYFPVLFIEPFNNITKVILGYDINSDVDRKASLANALETGGVGVTSKIGLLEKLNISGGAFGLRFFLPVTDDYKPHLTLEQRTANLKGFLSLVVPIDSLIETSLSSLTPVGINFAIYDETSPEISNFIYLHNTRVRASPNIGKLTNMLGKYSYADISYTRYFDFAGRRWKFVCYPDSVFIHRFNSLLKWGVFCLGLLITLLLAAYLFEIARRTARVELLVGERTTALKESEEKYKSLVDNITLGVALVNPQMQILAMNNQMKQWFPDADTAKQPICYKVFNRPPREEACSYCPTCKTLKDGLRHEAITETPLEDEIRNFRVISSAVKSVNGDIIAAIETIEDITVRKHFEDILDAQRRELQNIIDYSPVFIFYKDRVNKLIRVNKSFAESQGAKKEDLEGKSMFDLFPEYAEAYWSDDKEVIVSGRPKFGIIELLKTKQGLRWVQTDKVPFKDDKGNINGIIGFSVDITERKSSEELLKKSYNMLREIIEKSPFGIYIVNSKGQVEYVNDAMLKLSGETREQFLGLNVFDFAHYKEAGLIDKIKLGLNGEYFKIDNVEYTSYFGQMTTVRNFTGIPLEEGGSKKILMIVEDITERKRLERIKDDFISTVSHELRTPLSITKEGISLVLDGITGAINEKQARILTTSKDNIDRLARIINDLLDISKLEAGRVELKKEFFDITEMVKNIGLSFEPQIKKKGLNLKLDVPSEKINVYADPDKINQVFINLAGNCVKFTNEGYVEITIRELGDEVECVVADTGIGIGKDDLTKVFSKFQQFGRVAGPGDRGTGLGLSIVKGIIELHKGNIFVESQVKKGTKFTFMLPKYTFRQALKENIDKEIEEALRSDSKLSLIIIKTAIVDMRLMGTKLYSILDSMINIVKNSLTRKKDIVIKEDGQVIVILPDCDKENVLMVVGRIREGISKYLAAYDLTEGVKIKVGHATFPDEAKNDEDLVLIAESSNYS
ncbi:MAG: CHASE domain-containing protein [Candidatus Omnitrophica bacterium]|nr:CHASE domain-containing protein [Candidatus Omnitrophota bacterium]